jgi:RNA recognition motif-containing protein
VVRDRGIGFVMFRSRQAAKDAIRDLDHFMTKDGPLRVSASTSNTRLFVGNLPRDASKADVYAAIGDESDGMRSIELLQDPFNGRLNRGFAFATYVSHLVSKKAKNKQTCFLILSILPLFLCCDFSMH